MNLETLSAPLEIKLASNTDAGEFEGYGAFFGNTDGYGDAIGPGAFAKSLTARKARGLPLVPMHFNHGMQELAGERGVGVWLDMAEDAKGLRVRGRLSGMSTDRGRYLFERVKDGAISGLSIGFRIAPGGAERGSEGGPRRILKTIDLVEVSLVDEPANDLARVDSVKLAGIADLETLLRRGGLSKSAARRAAEGGWHGLSGEPRTPTPSDLDLKAFDRALARNLSELKGMIR